MLDPLQLLLEPASRLLERAARLSPAAGRLTDRLAGRVVELRFEPPGLSLHFRFEPRCVRLRAGRPTAADAVLTGSPLGFARMQLDRHPGHALFSGAVQVQGDLVTVRRMQRLLDALRPDLEPLLSRWLGAELAYRTVERAGAGRRWVQDVHAGLQTSLVDYLHDETRWLPAPLEAAAFHADVDVLRDDVERLALRIARLAGAGRSP